MFAMLATVVSQVFLVGPRVEVGTPLVLDAALVEHATRIGFAEQFHVPRDTMRPLDGALAFHGIDRMETVFARVFESKKPATMGQAIQDSIREHDAANLKPGSFSKLPFGDFCLGEDRRGRVTMEGHVGVFRGSSTLHLVMSASKDGATRVQADSARDRELVEGLARMTLAQAIGLDLVPAQPKPVNGKVCSDVLKTAGGTVAANVDEVCSALGVSLTKNPRLGSMTFQHAGKAIILALAANKVKVGPTWEPLDWFVARRGEKWYVPLDGLLQALGGPPEPPVSVSP